MNRVIVVLSLLFVATTGWSWQFKDNPDRVPSLGLNFTGTYLSGTGTFAPVSGFVFNTEDDLKDKTNATVADFRLPVSNNLTLSFASGYVSRKVERIDASLVPVTGGYLVVGDRLTDEYTGPTFSVGARYYFQ